jgi:MEMO1 family protein
MTLVGCFVTPHPPIIVPEVGGPNLSRVRSTVDSMERLAEEMATLEADTMVVTSPHTPFARNQMGVSFAPRYTGSLAFFRASQVRVDAEADVELARQILDQAVDRDVPVTVIGAQNDSMDLDHGVMVPLAYLVKKLSAPPRLVLTTFSYLTVEDHVRFGEAIGDAILQSPRRIVYLASADLSHRLTEDAPAGYDPLGQVFDHRVRDLLASGDWKGLLTIDRALVQAAGECGYRSLAVLAGVVRRASESGLRVRPQVLSYEGPFGVGYLVADLKVLPADEGGATQAREVAP